MLARALAAGFAAVDVEARDLERGDPEATAVPAERRWISRHRLDPLTGPDDLMAEWVRLRRHAGALHKLVVPAHDFRVNDWVLALVPDVGGGGESPRTIFATGGIGHVSRIVGYLLGNSVTYLAVEEGEETAAGQPTLRQALDVYQLPHLPPDPRLYGVLGEKAGASRSPELHNHAFPDVRRAIALPSAREPGPGPGPGMARHRAPAGLERDHAVQGGGAQRRRSPRGGRASPWSGQYAVVRGRARARRQHGSGSGARRFSPISDWFRAIRSR